jgi:protein-S-isoprenylcysteine O-methyltransferase Ste14
MVPAWLGFAAVVVTWLGLELQVRAVEEPYLLRTHGDEYRVYAARVGRFLPGVGRFG